jgi:hypothetical protein
MGSLPEDLHRWFLSENEEVDIVSRLLKKFQNNCPSDYK